MAKEPQSFIDMFARLGQDLKLPSLDIERKSFETAVRNTSEMAGLAGKSGAESLDILRQRIREGMAEVRQSYEKRK